MKKVLFTDLDGTILFSKNSLPKELKVENCVVAETYRNGHFGYMEKELVAFLQEWTQEQLFIPVTTRSTEQYERLADCFSTFNLPFALASNGGNLYRYGRLDLEWQAATKQELRKELNQKELVLELIQKMIPAISIRKIKDSDELYYCVLTIERIWEEKFILEVNKELAKWGWCAYFQHKKLYFLPKALSKERGITRLKEELTESAHYLAMGDTEMDYGMLKQQNQYLYFSGFSEKNLETTTYSLEKIHMLLEG